MLKRSNQVCSKALIFAIRLGLCTSHLSSALQPPEMSHLTRTNFCDSNQMEPSLTTTTNVLLKMTIPFHQSDACTMTLLCGQHEITPPETIMLLDSLSYQYQQQWMTNLMVTKQTLTGHRHSVQIQNAPYPLAMEIIMDHTLSSSISEVAMQLNTSIPIPHTSRSMTP